MGTIFIRALILYFVVIFSVRLMGKRQLGESGYNTVCG